MIRVVLADDQLLVRAGLRALFDDEDDVEVVAEVANGADAVAVTRATVPDVVIMDVRMPGMDGIQATRRIVADPALASAKVLILTTFDLDEYVYDSLRVGASGFVLKNADAGDLLHAVRMVARGETLLAPTATRRLIERFVLPAKQASVPAKELEGLTSRELEIMGLVALGLSNEDIARRLTISPATARTHVSRAMVKLGARDRAQLVVYAYQWNLVGPGDRGSC